MNNIIINNNDIMTNFKKRISLFIIDNIISFHINETKTLMALKLVQYERQGICPNAREENITPRKMMQMAKKVVLSFFMPQNLIFSMTNSIFDHVKNLKK